MSGVPRARLDLERVALLHGALVLLTAVTLWSPGGPPWILTAPANLLLPLTLPSLALGPILWRKKRVLLASLQAASIVVGLAFFASPLLEDCLEAPRRVETWEEFVVRNSSPRLCIASFNAGVGLARADAIARFLEDNHPGIAVILEATDRLAARLVPLIADRYPYRAVHSGGIDGKLVLSCYPIRSEELIRLEDGRPALRVEVEVNGEPLEIMAVHFSPAIGVLDRGAAAGRDLDRLSSMLDPMGASILAGDFNTTERSPSHARLLAAGFGDSFEEVGSGLGRTFPVFGRYFGLPIGRFMRIDYIWHGAALAARRAEVGPDLGSDHLPVIAEFEWRY